MYHSPSRKEKPSARIFPHTTTLHTAHEERSTARLPAAAQRPFAESSQVHVSPVGGPR